MIAYELKKYFKVILLLMALAISFFSLIYSNRLVSKLAVEEEKKIALWATAQSKIVTAETSEELEFLSGIVSDNTTIPVILVNVDGILIPRNLDSTKSLNPKWVKQQLQIMKTHREPLTIRLPDGAINYVYYDDSILLKQLRRYPFYQLGIVTLFILVSYFAFNYSRRAEENQVWVGLAKETAHQLGTPISSLLAWIELIETDRSFATGEAMNEMKKDIVRLKTITDRFSKIGSTASLKQENLIEVLENAVHYMQVRSSEEVKYEILKTSGNIIANLNIPLFEWVIENICKNAMDAMEGRGRITFQIRSLKTKIIIDITDTGKGIPKNLQKTVFKPGFTTKKRGWGLGLSLVKRIIENYHKGHIFVKESVLGKGTTFRIILKKPAPGEQQL